MRKLGFVLPTLLVLAACANVPPITANGLDVPILPQQQSMWCWAASGQMAMRYLGHDVSQCTEVNNEYGQTSCCTTVSDTCNQGGWPEYAKYHFGFIRTSSTALSFAQVKDEIDHNRPIAFTWAWTGGGGHVMVIKGYITVGSGQYVVINDPEPYTDLNTIDGGSTRILTYADYVSGSDYSHWDDFYNIHYTGSP